MPRYFFHSLDEHADYDTDGTELDGDHTAKTEAVMYIAELLRGNPAYVWNGSALRVTVTSEAGELLFTIVATCEVP